VITGASRGIGRGLADGYRARGWSVIGTARAADDALGTIALDVTEPAAFEGLGTHVGDAPIDLLICNAGIFADRNENITTGYPASIWAEQLATNVTGVFLTIQTLLPNLRAARGAKIAIISSQLGSTTRARGGFYIYRASKAAVLNLGRNLAEDLRPEGIAVGIYHPGWVRTDMGGSGADIPVAEARDGLMARFEALGPATTGEFLTWDGRPHPY